MAFIDRIVGPDEKLIGILSVHWIYFLKGALWFIAFSGVGALARGLITHWVLAYPVLQNNMALLTVGGTIFWIMTAIGICLFLFYTIMYMTTELALTTQRVIFKRGWLMVSVKESDLEEIKAADVDNGIFGRIFNYGYINFDARFVQNLTLPAIGDPYRFLKAMNEARTRLKEDTARPIFESQESVNMSVPEPKMPPRDPRDIPPEYIPPNMQDERYRALEDDPIEAVENMMNEYSILRKANEAEQREAHETGYEDYDLPTSRPILFKRSVKERKKQLAQKLRNSFQRKSRKRHAGTQFHSI